MLSIFGVASTGVNFYRTSLDAIANNVANLNTVRPPNEVAVQRQVVVGSANPSPAPAFVGPGGVVGAGVSFRVEYGSSPEGRLVFEPDHPLADESGYVRYPGIDLSQEMTDMVIAQRGYQANLAVVQRATEAYQAALQLGR